MKIVNIALGQIGTKETPGAKDNPEVLKYFEAAGANSSKLHDETSWCSAFINFCAKEANLERSMNLTARSWLKVGKRVETPQLGDIAIFWRVSRKSWQGHVGIFIRQHEDKIYVLGGNQNNEVNITAYPVGRLLGYVRL